MIGSFYELIAQHSKDFTESQQKIAEYVLRDPSQVAFKNARELAEAVGTSESSVIRFAYSAGFDGYRAFQDAAQQIVNSTLTMQQRYLQYRPRLEGNIVEETVRADIHNLQRLERTLNPDDVKAAAQRIARARRCYVVGFRAAAAISLLLSGSINQLCHNAIDLSIDAGHAVDLLVGAGPEDVLVAISFRRYGRRTQRIAQFCHQRGVFVIAITDSLFSPLRSTADILLAADIESTSSIYSHVGPLCIKNCLMLALNQEVGDRAPALVSDWEETYRHFDLLGGLEADKDR